jgi:hypothetical protein
VGLTTNSWWWTVAQRQLTQRSGWRRSGNNKQADYRSNQRVEVEEVVAAAKTMSPADLAAKPGSYVTAARQAGGAEQLLAAAIMLSPAKLAAKPGRYVAAALSAGGAEQLVAAATTLSRAELVGKPYTYLYAMARASERCAGADGVTCGIYQGFEGSTRQVLADYIVKTRQIRQGKLLAKQQGGLGALLVKQQGEIQLLASRFLRQLGGGRSRGGGDGAGAAPVRWRWRLAALLARGGHRIRITGVACGAGRPQAAAMGALITYC